MLVHPCWVSKSEDDSRLGSRAQGDDTAAAASTRRKQAIGVDVNVSLLAAAPAVLLLATAVVLVTEAHNLVILVLESGRMADTDARAIVETLRLKHHNIILICSGEAQTLLC